MLISICVGSIRARSIGALIQSVADQHYRDWELIIAVQGRDPQLIQLVEQAAARDQRIRFVQLDRFGRSYALNQAMSRARGDILAFTDDDCEAAPDWLDVLADCFRQQPDVGLVGGDLIAPRRDSLWPSTCPATYTIECIYRPAEAGFSGPPGFYWGGANFAVRRETLQQVGPFDEYLGVGTQFPSAEDVDFALRVEALGIPMWTTPRSKIYHTYGRRYGIRAALRHHRGYALGSGALGGKLTLWGHKLMQTWGQPTPWTVRLRDILHNPARGLLQIYTLRYDRIGTRRYLAEFEIDARPLSHPKIAAARPFTTELKQETNS